MEELIHSLQEGVIGRLWPHICHGMNERPRAATRKWHYPGLTKGTRMSTGMGPSGKVGQKVSTWHKKLRNSRTEAMGSGGKPEFWAVWIIHRKQINPAQ